MIKLNVSIWAGDEDTDLEYEISEELADFLLREYYQDDYDDIDRDDEIDLELFSGEVEDIINNSTRIPEHLCKELNAIDLDAWDEADLLAAEIAERMPDDWDIYGWMEKDIESGLFVPDKSFEQFLEEIEFDADDESYDEEDARADYYFDISDSYADWVEKLPIFDREERYGRNDPSFRIDYQFVSIDMTAKG